jgi:hypothetical protein
MPTKNKISQMGHYTSFVLKIWVEEGNMVRGEIRHMRTGASIYFMDVKKMWEFVLKYLNGRDEYTQISPVVEHLETSKTQNQK